MKISKYVSWVSNEEETAVINTNTQKCLVLNKTGFEIWSHVEQGLSLDEIVSALKDAYVESDVDVIRKDVEELVSLLLEYEMVEVDES